MSEESPLLLPAPSEPATNPVRTRRPRQRKPEPTITTISQQPAALEVATAPKGSNEDSTSARLPASYPYRTRLRRQDYEKAKHLEKLKHQ